MVYCTTDVTETILTVIHHENVKLQTTHVDHPVVHIVMPFSTFHSLDNARKYQPLSFILPVSDARSPQTLRWKAMYMAHTLQVP